MVAAHVFLAFVLLFAAAASESLIFDDDDPPPRPWDDIYDEGRHGPGND